MTEEKDEQKDWPNCVFYPNVKCHVRHEIRGGFIDKYVKPFEKGTDEAQIILKIGDAMKQMFSSEWMVLHAYCQICPFKVRIDRAVLAKALEETMAVMKVVKEQLREEGVLPK